MRSCLALALITLAVPHTVLAGQQTAPPDSLERVKTALERPPSTFNLSLPPLWSTPSDQKRLGPLTFVAPDGSVPGQVVAVRVPVGEWIMDGIKAIKTARYRRAEGRARDEVRRALETFMVQERIPQ